MVVANRHQQGPDRGERAEINRRLRLEYVVGTEAEWQRRLGRPLTAAELGVLLHDYPGDLDPGTRRPQRT